MKLQNTELLRTRNLIAGQWVDADAGGKLAVLNPASGDKLADVPLCGADETRRAIDAANAAWPAWRALTARRRSQILQAWNRLILDNAEDLAQIVTAECGKPLAEARGEVIYGASFVEWFAEEGKRTYGESIPSPASNTRLLVIKQPIGVCAAITPWNFPLAMITRKVAPALAAGCPVVVKPAEATPLTALALAVLAEQAGLQVAQGIVIDANSQTSHPDIYAAGDACSQIDAASGQLLRRETWESAKNQAVAASHAMLGLPTPVVDSPWFWTDQCGLNIQFAGDMQAPEWVVRGELAQGQAVLFGQALLLKLLLGLFSFNKPGTILFRQLIGRHQFHLRPDAQLDELLFLPFLNVVTEIKNFAA